MLMHRGEFVANWMVGIKTRMARMCKEGYVMAIILLFYNDAATEDILESKRKLRLERAAIDDYSHRLARIPWCSVGEWLSGHLKMWRQRIAVRIRLWFYEPSEEALYQCLNSPEFEIMKYLHKLTERMTAWRAYPHKELPSDQLSAQFLEVKGALDAPHAEYERLCRIQEMADAFIPADMQRTMFALMLSEKMGQTRPLKPSHRE
jgi:hypothetical protein